MDIFRRYSVRYDKNTGGGSFEPEPSDDPDDIRSILHREMNEFRSFVDGLNSLFKIHSRGLDLECGYLIDNRIDAKATIFEEKDIIAVYLGLCIFMRNLFYRFAEDGIIDGILYTGTIPFKSNKNSIQHNIDLESELSKPSPACLSRPDIRIICRKLLASSIQWILHHELAHLWNGHVDLIQEWKGSAASFDESESASSSDMRLIAMELDADSRATHATMMTHCRLIGGSRNPKIDESFFVKRYWSFDVLLYYIAIQSSILSILAIKTMDPLSIFGTTHPAPRLRRWWHHNGTISAFRNESSDRRREIERVVGLGNHACLFGIASALGGDIRSAMRSLQPVKSDLSEFKAAWNTIHPELNRLKRGLILPGRYINGEQEETFPPFSDRCP